MDTSSVIVEYSAGDFADALRLLLPKGEYWQEVDNQELTNLIIGMAIDFKQTHDEIQLSLLTDFSDSLFGWKLRDYQNLLNETVSKSGGVVFDDIAVPNMIFIEMYDAFRSSCKKAWEEFEKKRLPHTEFAWIFNSRLNYHHQLATCRHIRNYHKYEVLQ
ncbi:hypothetical protein CSW98_15900 [Vibrio sp. HA2012]|uniref:hypothetical protein n=1 Tax=Vibrio sp. HA2012 TaxID=1971595 RepID=UPI000C2C620F|nr:hypothetical protein [Vibrio sp. HA2012]PJC85309.1 hypothetical protein CSW98_15900 [Vibrio sp. HA2012]